MKNVSFVLKRTEQLYSIVDRFTNPTDSEKIIAKMRNTLVYNQEIDDTQSMNQIDFVWSIQFASKIYAKIIDFLDGN